MDAMSWYSIVQLQSDRLQELVMQGGTVVFWSVLVFGFLVGVTLVFKHLLHILPAERGADLFRSSPPHGGWFYQGIHDSFRWRSPQTTSDRDGFAHEPEHDGSADLDSGCLLEGWNPS